MQIIHLGKNIHSVFIIYIITMIFLSSCDGTSIQSISNKQEPVGFIALETNTGVGLPFARTDIITDQEVTLVWSAPDNNAVVEIYEIFLDSNLVAETEETEITLTQLKPSTNYKILINALDENYQPISNGTEFSFVTEQKDANRLVQSDTDTQPPTSPQKLRATSIGRNHATLYWNAASDNLGVAGYEIFQNQSLLITVTKTRLQLTDLAPETVYNYSIRALDQAGNKSNPSNTIAVETGPAFGIEVAHGNEIYAQRCAFCHGVEGQGVGNTIGVTRQLTLAELTTIIDQTMPTINPSSCVADCAASVAQYIFDNFAASEATIQEDPFAGFQVGAAQISDMCGRIATLNRDDVVRDTFCGTNPAQINSLAELQSALGLTFNNPTANGRRNNGANGNPSFAITGHSTSLVAHEVNAINPRAIIFTANRTGRRGGAPNAPPGFVATGFVRGDLLVEIIAADRVTNELGFYLARFTVPCNETNSCTPGDLLTPAVESNWTSFTIYDEINLSNTIIDCLHCHQPNGPGTTKILRMQELENPWSHWFRSNRASRVLIDDFFAARGTTESYAGIPANLISASDPRLLENLVRGAGFRQQPNEFDSRRIQREVRDSSPQQPADNTVPGVSTTWEALNQQTILANEIAVPYHDIKVTDPVVISEFIQAYQNLQAGGLSVDALPDLRDAFYPAQLREIGFKVTAGLNAPDILSQACGQCHNSSLSQDISRARFNIDLSAMSDLNGGVLIEAERDMEIGSAINRLQLTQEDIRLMPPKGFRKLDQAEIDSVTAYLCSQTTGTISQCAGNVAITLEPY